jgi:hypothetical protein
VCEHPLLSDLRTFLGMLSDSYAHFTPEFEGGLKWSEEIKQDVSVALLLEYFDTSKRVIHGAFLNLAAIHLKLLEVFNACYNNGLAADANWSSLRAAAWALGNELAVEFTPHSPVTENPQESAGE